MRSSGLDSSFCRDVDDVDFEFENAPVRIVAVRNVSEIRVAGTVVGPYDEGREFEVKYWVAWELVKSGFARFLEGYPMDLVSLNKVQWKEPIQVGMRLSTLPEYFYPRLRRFLAQLKEEAVRDASAAEKYSKAVRLAQDIIECRLKKIVNLAASPEQTEDILKTFSREEKILYDTLHSLVYEWKKKMTRFEASK